MEKQTAVEFLKKKLTSIFVNDKGFQDLFEQAKQMEIDQIENAWNSKAYDDGNVFVIDNRSAQQYIEDTYNIENK